MTATFPDTEKFGLVTQLRRAATSIPANLAEGHARDHTREYLRHVSIARGSLAEVETFLVLSIELNFATEKQLESLFELTNRIGQMISRLQRALRQKLNAP